MECDACKEDNASIFLTEVVEGKVKKVNLCQTCAEEKGVNNPKGFNLAELLKGIGEQTIQPKSSRGLICPKCGFSQGDFKKTGRMGCSECYDIFTAGLEGLLKAMHKGLSHMGKAPHGFEAGLIPEIPAAAGADDEPLEELEPEPEPVPTEENRIEALQEKLASSIEEENYEEAARIRDELRQIEAEVASSESES
ncbi:MAG: protein arginine kinase activator [Verrucomicrobiales bacterium]|jgi:protein arginine kinase activator